MSENNKDLTTSQKTEKVQKKETKPGFIKRAAKWVHELKVEAKKVIWPNKQTVTKNTIVVIIALIVLCAVVTVLDVVFGGIRDLLASLVG